MKFADGSVCQQCQCLKHLNSGFVFDIETLGRDFSSVCLSVKQKPAANVSAVLKQKINPKGGGR